MGWNVTTYKIIWMLQLEVHYLIQLDNETNQVPLKIQITFITVMDKKIGITNSFPLINPFPPLFPNTNTSNNSLNLQYLTITSSPFFHVQSETTLRTIQYALEDLLDDYPTVFSQSEVTYDSNVLSIILPPHGTWIINKQSANEQVWWSSPLSGPRRFEWKNRRWIYSRYSCNFDNDIDEKDRYLDTLLKAEIQALYGIDLKLDI